MLIYSKERYYPSMINVLILQDEEGGYYYVHRDTYDQALMLTEAYSDKTAISKLFESITNMAVAEKAYNFLPKPINILAPFLCLVDGDLDIEKKEDIIGALHILTQTLNMRRIVTLPSQARNSLTFSLHIIEEYKSSWESFFLSFGAASAMAGGVKAVTPSATAVQHEVVNNHIPAIPEEFGKMSIPAPNPKSEDSEENTIMIMDDDEDELDALMAKFEAETAAAHVEEDKVAVDKKQEATAETKKSTKDWGF